MSLESKLTEFKNNYGVEVDFEQFDRQIDATIRLRRVNQFFSLRRSREVTPVKDHYFTGLMLLLQQHVKKQVQISEDQNVAYTMSNFDIAKFIRDYEELVDLRHKETSSEPREALAGIKPATLLKNVVKNSATVDKPMYMFLAERMEKGEMSMETLRNITDNALSQINTKTTWSMEDRSGANGRSLSNVIMAQQAMRALNKQRGFFWILGNFSQWRAEKAYLKYLTQQLERCKNNGLPVDEYTVNCSTPILKSAREKSQADVQAMSSEEHHVNVLDPSKALKGHAKVLKMLEDEELAKKKLEEEEAEKKLAKQKEKFKEDNEVKPNISAMDKLTEITSDPQFTQNFTNELMEGLPACNSNQKMFVQVQAMSFKLKIQKHAQAFDEAESDFKIHLHNCAKSVFQQAFMLTDLLSIKGDVDRIVTAQIITDKVMKMMSPVTVDPKAFGEFANGYAFKHAEEFNEFLQKSGVKENVQDVYNQAQQRYDRKGISVEDEVNQKDDIVPLVKNEADVNALNIEKKV